MSGQAANLTDQDILDLAAYYGDMEPIQSVAGEENLELGESIYRGGIAAAGVASCMGCHGPGRHRQPRRRLPEAERPAGLPTPPISCATSVRASATTTRTR